MQDFDLELVKISIFHIKKYSIFKNKNYIISNENLNNLVILFENFLGPSCSKLFLASWHALTNKNVF